MAAAHATLPPIERAKLIKVYINGDGKFPGKQIVVNKRHIANFDKFLEHATDKLCPYFGSFRKLYTPVNGHQVTELDQVLKRGEASYVAANQDRFKKLGYLEIEVSPRKKFTRDTKIEVKPVRHSRIQTSGRIRKCRTVPLILFIHTNGNDLENPHRIQLRPREQGSWEMVFDAIKERVSLRWGGAIRKLCCLDGQLIQSVHELENLGCYVACGSERFVRKDYENPKVVMTSPRQERRTIHHGLKLTPISNKSSKKGSQDSSVNRTPDSNSGAMNNKPRKARRNQIKKEDQIIHEKPVAYKRNGKKEVNYDEDPGGVFRPRKENQATRGAREVNEDRNTRVEVPVDQREAEVVEDEEIDTRLYQKASPGRGRKASISGKSDDDNYEKHSPRKVSFEGDQGDREGRRTTPYAYNDSRASEQYAVGPRNDDFAMENQPEGFEDEEWQNSKREENIESPGRNQTTRQDERENDTNQAATPPMTRKTSVDRRDSVRETSPTNNDNSEEVERGDNLGSPGGVRDGYNSRYSPPPYDNEEAYEAKASTPVRTPTERDDEENVTSRTPEPDYEQNERKEEHQSRESKTPVSSSRAEEERAAVTIQSHYRGYQSRKEHGRPKKDNNLTETSRNEEDGEAQFKEDEESQKAAIVIQKNYRGYKSRKQLRNNDFI